MHQAPPGEGDMSGGPVQAGRAEVRAAPGPRHLLGTQASPGLGSEQEGPPRGTSQRQAGWMEAISVRGVPDTVPVHGGISITDSPPVLRTQLLSR